MESIPKSDITLLGIFLDSMKEVRGREEEWNC